MHTKNTKTSRRMWYVTLCEDMLALADGGTEGGVIESVVAPRTMKSDETKAAKENFLDPTHPAYRQRMTGRHFLGDTECNASRKNCVVCYKTSLNRQGEKRVQTFCRQCNLFMHADCFDQ